MPCAAEALRPGAGERDLADGGGGLALLELQGARRQLEDAAAERDRAGGDDEHVAAARARARRVVGERGEPVARSSRRSRRSTSSAEPILTTMRR